MQVRAALSSRKALISALKLEIAKLKHAQFGASPECSPRLIDQVEWKSDDPETTATADGFTAETLEMIARHWNVGQSAPRQIWTAQVHLP